MIRLDNKMLATADERLLRALPKVELHCHLDGSVPLHAFRQWAHQYPQRMPTGEQALRQAVHAPRQCADLAEYLTCFDLAIEQLHHMEFLRLTARTLIARLSAENVIYAELRFAPWLLADDEEGCETLMDVLLDEVEQAGRKHGVKVQVILCMLRHHDKAHNLFVLELADMFRQDGVCGVDLAGDEAEWPLEDFVPLFHQAAKLGIGYTIHAGETGGVDNMRIALELAAPRVGHGIAAAKDDAVMEALAERGVLLEICPTSNLQTGASSGWPAYPFDTFVNRGVKVSVNTDNRTVSDTTLSNEYGLLAQHYDFVDGTLLFRMTMDALEGAFLPPTDKESLRAQIYAGYGLLAHGD